MIIKVYGEFWSRDRVDWKARQLPGVRKGKKHCDVWNQRGIYALYEDFRIVYIGQADNRAMGKRLDEHRKDRFAERWDSFSFFGICDVDAHGKAKPARRATVLPTSAIRSLELLAILLSDAPLNRARGKFPDGAEKVFQLAAETERGSSNFKVGQALSDIVSQIERLQSSIAAKNRRTAKGRRASASKSVS